MVSFESQKISNFDQAQFTYFLLLLVLVLYLRNHCLVQDHIDLCLFFVWEFYNFSIYLGLDTLQAHFCVCVWYKEGATLLKVEF